MARLLNAFRNVPVTALVALVAVVPSLAAGFFAYRLVSEAVADRMVMEELERQVIVATDLSRIVHALQRERGTTSIHLSTQGDGNRAAMVQERGGTDTALAALDAGLARSAAALDPAFARMVGQLRTVLGEIGGVRERVDGRTIARDDAIAAYTRLNGQMIAVSGGLARGGHAPRISSMLDSYTQLLEVKERAGLERATAGGGFAAGRFTEAQLDRMRQLVIAQAIHERLFRQSADPAHAAALDEAMRAPAAAEVGRIRGVIFGGGLSGELQGIGPQIWFKTISEKIDALKQLEDRISADLLQATGALAASAAADERATALISAAILAGVAALVVLSVAVIRLSFKGVTVPMMALASGETDVALPFAGRNEFGAMVRALEVFRATAIQKAALDADERARAASALLRADAMEALRHSLTDAVTAAGAGDFSKRVAAESRERDLADLAASVNALLGTVDATLAETVAMLTAMADADLTRRMSGTDSGAFGLLRDGANRTAESLAALIGDIRRASSAATAGAAAIEKGSDDLAGRSESQAASLEETAATMEELAKSIATTADSLATAEALAAEAQGHARSGRTKVEGAVDAVRRIESSAAKIREIVGVIDGIAFQTNLLALNAGVEAARAGDAGRGFAVVAFEVRALAERCAEAARDIQALVRDSSKSVTEGVVMVDAAGAALLEIDSAVGQLGGAIADIAHAGREQALGVAEISQAISGMDAMTQQNAALADETLRHARSLAAEVRRLSEASNAFRIGDGNREPRAA